MAGPWEKYQEPQQALPPNPIRVTQAKTDIEQGRASIDRTRAEIANEAARIKLAQQAQALAERKAAIDAAKAAEDTAKAQAEADAANYGRPLPSPPQFADALAQYNAADFIEKSLTDLRTIYGQGPGATTGAAGVFDFNPLSVPNQRFNTAANRLRAWAKQGTGTTGGENNSLAEMKLNLGAYIPSSYNFDATNADNFAAIQDLADKSRKQAIQRLGGIPDANGRVMPLPARDVELVSEGPVAAPFGSKDKQVPIPAEMQAAYDSFLQSWDGDPDKYVAMRNRLDRQFGFPQTADGDKSYRDFATGAAKTMRTGGTIKTRIPGPNRPMSNLEINRNDLVNSPLGAFAAGALDNGGFGAVSALAGDQMGALNDEHPLAMGLGQVAGAITGTSALGKLGANTFGRFSPKLLGGGGKGALGRNLLVDGIYGTTTGVNQGMDAGTAAGVSALGSVGGQAVGKGLGAAMGGIAVNPQALKLRARIGDNLTIGQMLGGKAKSIEDAMTSIPLAGDAILARRGEGFRAFNQAAFDEAGAPINAQGLGVAEQGLDRLLGNGSQKGAIGGAYDAATSGVRVPLDPQFSADLSAIAPQARKLPPDLFPRFTAAMDNRIQPIVQAGEMTGDAYQQAQRGLKGYRAEATKPGFEQDYRDALGQLQDALRSQMERGGGKSVTTGLSKADEAYRMAKVLQRASMGGAKNGTASGEIQIFTPAQLNNSASQNAAKFGGKRPFADLIDLGQQVLPSKLPDSGTAKRLMIQSGVGGGLLGMGAGAGYAGGDTQAGTLGTAAAILALTAGGSKTGQKALQKMLFDRPDAAKSLGKMLRGKKAKGMFGAAAVPLSLESSK